LFFFFSSAQAEAVGVYFSNKIDVSINEDTVKEILTSKFVQKNLRLGIVVPTDNNPLVESFTDYNWRELNKLWRIRFFTGRALMPLLFKDTKEALTLIKSDNNTIIVVFDDSNAPPSNGEYRYVDLKN
jgi:molybdate-binding protein